MKIYLDLLPEEKKQEIKKKRDFLKIIQNEFLFSIPIIAFFLIILTVNFSLKIRTQAVENNSNTGNSQKDYQELERYQNSFNEINLKTSAMFKIQKDHLNWLNVFRKMNEIVPENVNLSDLVTINYGISLAGKAKTRDDFLKFQEKIKAGSCFSDVEVPLSSLVSKENVEFQINLKVKEECLKNRQL